jgi:uncharacterized protein (TIGR03067 family)
MDKILVPVLMGVMLTGALAWSRDDKQQQTSAYIGDWKIVAGEKAGQKEPAERIEGTKVRIAQDTILVMDQKDRRVYLVKYEVNGDKQPHSIKMTVLEGPLQGTTARGVIELKEDTLKLCYSPDGENVPTRFATAKGVNQLLFVMKRTK